MWREGFGERLTWEGLRTAVKAPLWASEPLAWGLREFASKTSQQNQDGWKSHALTYQVEEMFMG